MDGPGPVPGCFPRRPLAPFLHRPATMRLELIPVLLGALLALVGLGLLADAWIPDGAVVPTERRRRARAPRHPLGEGLLGLGVLCFAAALIGRDAWRWGTVAVIAGTLLLVLGVVLNGRYLREVVAFRGAARRGTAADLPRTDAPPATRPPSGARAEPTERRRQPR